MCPWVKWVQIIILQRRCGRPKGKCCANGSPCTRTCVRQGRIKNFFPGGSKICIVILVDTEFKRQCVWFKNTIRNMCLVHHCISYLVLLVILIDSRQWLDITPQSPRSCPRVRKECGVRESFVCVFCNVSSSGHNVSY